MSHSHERVRPLILNDVEVAVAARHVQPLPRRVVEQIVGVPDDVERGCLPAVRGIEDEHLGRAPAAYKYAVVRLVERPLRRQVEGQVIDPSFDPRQFD